jgi:hypothetical protein
LDGFARRQRGANLQRLRREGLAPDLCVSELIDDRQRLKMFADGLNQASATRMFSIASGLAVLHFTADLLAHELLPTSPRLRAASMLLEKWELRTERL